MNNLLNLLTVSVAALVLGGCATNLPVGGLFTNVTLPVGATSNNGAGSKVGEADCASYLAMISTGDCSIDTAKKNGGISTVTHADWQAHNILGLIGHYKVVVHGD
ncbi:MAG: TRL-like family protein [Methyloglobulus sp.]|nr:TRL-like protein family [Methyloglobulus sp.]